MKRNHKKELACFTKWSRKNYAAFAWLDKVFKLGVLPVTMSIVVLQAEMVSAQTQSDTIANEKRSEIEALLVTAPRLNPTRGVTTPTDVYIRDTTGVVPQQTIESALRINPAVDLRERGGKGVQADISLRGGTCDQTMVLLNGIDFTDVRTGHQSHSLPVDIDIISRIEIINGLTGIGAYAGAVNMVTSPLRPNYMRMELTGGAYGYGYANLSGAVTRGGLNVMAAGSARRSDGYTFNTDFNNTNLFVRATNSDRRGGFLDIQAGYQRRDFGSNGFYSLAYPNQFEHTETYLASARWHQTIGAIRFEVRTSYRKNNDRYELFRGGKGAPEGWTPNYHTTDSAGGEINAAYTWKAGETSAGINYTYNQIYSNVLGEPLTEPIVVPGAEAVYTRTQHRNIVNGWLSHRVTLRSRTTLACSGNLAGSPYGTFPSWSISAVQNLGGGVSIEASGVRSMRLPTFTDLYYTNATHIGNPSLQPEHALTGQAAIRYVKGRFAVSGTGYYRHGTNIIDWALVETPEGEKWQSTQLTDLNTCGGEIQLVYSGRRILRRAAVSYGTMSIDKTAEGYISKYALDYMRNKLAIQCSIDIWRGFACEMTASWYDRNNTPDITYAPYWLLDLRLSWSHKIFTVYAEATNLLNSVYYDFVGLIQPPRWLSAGVVVTI